MAAGVPSVDESRLRIEEKSAIVYRFYLESQHIAGSTFRLKDPLFHGMRWSKWGDLSPYWEKCTALATGGAQASWGLVGANVLRNDSPLIDSIELHRSNCPSGPNSCTADIHRSSATELTLLTDLIPGDEIVVTMGDIEGCLDSCDPETQNCTVCLDCGFETPDRSFTSVPLEAEWCLEGECESTPTVYLDFSAKPQIQSVWLSLPSQIKVNTEFPLKAALLDYRGNPISQAGITLSLSDESIAVSGSSHSFEPRDGGWHDFLVQLDTPGIHRLELYDAQGQTYISPPVEVLTEHPSPQIYWGDIHVHHGFTSWMPDGQRVDHNHVYGRDVMGLDIVSESIKARGIEIMADELWSELQDNCTQYTEEGRYLALLGFEWIGDPAAIENCGDNSCSQGHHNIYYDNCDGELGDLNTNIIDGLEGDKGLWTWLKQSGSTYTSIPHAMQFTHFDYEAKDPLHQWVAEIYSEWGDNSTTVTSGSISDMLQSGLRLGWIGGSDNHDGWMGNPFSNKNTPSGLAAFWLDDLNHGSLFEGLEKRQVYATTGHRPILDFYITDKGVTLPMGTAYFPSQPTLKYKYHGTQPVQSLIIYQISEDPNALRQVLYQSSPASLDIEDEIELPQILQWPLETNMAIWIEIIQNDGEKAWSSPVWLISDCEDSTALDPLSNCDGNSPSNDSGNYEDVPPDPTSPKLESRCQSIKRPNGGLFLFFILMLFRRHTVQNQEKNS